MNPINEPYFAAPRVITPPGSAYGPATRAFQGIPSLACGSDRRLWAVWYGGPTPGEDKNNYVILAVSEDHGQTWSEEKVVIEHEDAQVRCFDPEIWLAPDGRLWLFWAQHPADDRRGSLSGVWAITANEADGPDAEWSAPFRLCDGVMMCKPIVLASGEWALPVSFWHRREQGSAAMVVSTDQGQTWAERGATGVPPKHRNHDEHMLVELRDERLWMLVRTNYGIGESTSEDGGYSWSPLEPAAIPHVRSRFFIRRLASGNLLLVRHAPANEAYAGWYANAFSEGQRSHLTAFLSEDDGRTWPHRLLLDDRDRIAYPDGDQAADGTIHITYDFRRTSDRQILLASFREEDVMRRTPDTPSVRLRGLINKAIPPFRVIPEDIPHRGILFVDHQKQDRSGHGGNCLTECTNGDIVAFYSNVSGELNKGHGTYGWSEYRRSTDGGNTWSEPVVLDYSRQVYQAEESGSALVFAATTAPDGTLVAFVSHFAAEGLWIKQASPVVLRSRDHGRTWSEPRPLDPDATVEEVSLTFDAVFVRDGKIYIVYMGGSANFCPGPYALYVSADNGATFERRSELPFDHQNYYVTAGVLDSGEIIVYSYPYKGEGVEPDEKEIPYLTSADDGHTWSEVKTTRFAKRIRNPQMSEKIGDWYFLHGRSGSHGPIGEEKGNLVLYASRDGIRWDGGTLLYRKDSGGGDCYSANAVIGRHRDGDTERLLIQSSIAYEEGSSKVNECHWWIEPKSQ